MLYVRSKIGSGSPTRKVEDADEFNIDKPDSNFVERKKKSMV
jgi:hypothetical protein